MKIFPRYSLLIPLLTASAVWTAAAEPAGTPPAAAAKHGYTVMVEVKVNDKGETESVRLVDTDDKSVGDILSKMALAMALKTDLPARQKDGKPIKYTARLPFFFPIEGDEGPEANLAPKPMGKGKFTMPLYPRSLLEQGVVGGVIFELRVDEQGRLAQLNTLRASHPEFEAAAREVVQKWEFQPAQKDGQPVASRWNLAVAFETADHMADLKWRVPPRPSFGTLIILPESDAMTPATPETAPTAGEAPAAAPTPPGTEPAK
ncbi:energy transducer TonB [Opitutus terrae]|uniref:TonB family protein n=1 Tax=Opitutus terrae (strain DSM 11246 / JCM 15787 / PB90-1) TaxID=452637 RepID=B1ZXR8_OPITP|nr:energy transducer TonB [Opitutus terrae]ACB74290.1 TonB family protein [Opitutus terrae PB90-1]